MPLQQLTSSQVSPEVPVNENFAVLAAYAVYGYRADTSSGLTWGYYGGRWGGFSIAESQTLTLTGSATNYIVVSKATGAASVSTSSTNWDDTTNYARVYLLTTSSTAVTATEDHRAGVNGVVFGSSIPVGAPRIVDAITAVNATSLGLVDGDVVVALGGVTAGDGLADPAGYTYDADSAEAVNGNRIVAPTGGGGRLIARGDRPYTPRLWGADGVGDDVAAFNSWTTFGGFGRIPAGNWTLTAGSNAPTAPRVIISDNAQYNGLNFPLLGISGTAVSTKSMPACYVYVRQDTVDRDDTTTAFFHRQVTTDPGSASNGKSIRAYTNKAVGMRGTEFALSGELDNYADIADAGDAATSGVSKKYGQAVVFAGHFQSLDYNKFASAAAVTAIVGVETNLPVVGLDNPSTYGLRRCFDIISRTNGGVAGWDVNDGTNWGNGEIGCGVMIRSGTSDASTFRFGVAVVDGTGGGTPIATGVQVSTAGANAFRSVGVNTDSAFKVEGAGAHGFRTVAAHATAAFSAEGNSLYGMSLTGSFTNAAIRVAGGQRIAMESTSAIHMRYDATIWGFFSSATERIGLQMSGTGTGVRVNGTKVIGAQGAAVADATDAASAITQLNALLARARAHGLIAT